MHSSTSHLTSDVATSPPPVPKKPANGERPPKTSRGVRRKSKIGVVIEPVASAERNWRENFKFWIKSAAGLGYVLSLLTHVSMLLMLAIWLIPQIVGDHGFSINASTADDSLGEQNEILDTKFELPEIEAATEAPQVIMPMESTTTLSENEIAADISARIQASMGEGAEVDEPELGGGEPGKNAVVKGSFTAWTVPEDPDPGQDYKIFIRIKLPERIKDDYALRDLTGLVIGTDGYRQVIPGPKSPRRVKVRRGFAQFSVTVPGAYRLVKDRIRVHSHMLEEEQLLEIVF